MGSFHRLGRRSCYLSALVAVALVGCATVWQRPAGDTEQPAPAIEGVAADGQPMRLAEYRGQVVLLSFWHGL